MILLEQLYRLLPADTQVRLLDPFLRRRGLLAGAVQVDIVETVPERHVLILTHVLARFVPGAAQNVTAGSHIRVQDASGLTLTRLDVLPNDLAANVIDVRSWQSELALPAGCSIVATGTFNAAVAGNQVELDIAGMMIPLGNVERV